MHLRSVLPAIVRVTVLVGATLTTALPLQTAAQTPSVPKFYPIRDFFSNPEQGYFRLSDDGSTLGFMQPVSVNGAP